ncbi:MAG TPA: PilT/PilU family type 4a pilus ATPase [Clostridiales bacterium]|nr:PilT/PilU family type 4a pilus ATPase [Clostridiales bacterium]
MELRDILSDAVNQNASDIFLIAGRPVSFKIKGVIIQQGDDRLKPEDTLSLVDEMYTMSGGRDAGFRKEGDDDFAISLPEVGRFRVNIYKQRGTWGAVLRVVAFQMPLLKETGIPQSVIELGNLTKGLVLVTGTAGSGKSTTMTYIIDYINKNRNCHILTLEDPIEYLHKHGNSIVSQREIGIDSPSYSKALRAAMRESPDVIFIGEMRDHETIEIAMTAAETGHLVFSTLHTIGAANTIDRIIDVFPPNQQLQIRFQLSMVLKGIVSQQLLRSNDGLVPAFEILEANSAVRTMIRDGKVHQIDSVILASSHDGMKSMDQSILELYRAKKIGADTALTYCMNMETMKRNLMM